MASLYGKVIAITGAASGIGRATAILLSKYGAILALADINEAGLQETAGFLEDISGQPPLLSLVDVTNGDEVNRWMEAVVAKFGTLDGAANIAGVFISKSLMSTTEKDWNLMMNVNVFGVFNCLRAQVAHMKNGGSIVTVASAAGVRGLPSAPVYSASKHAVVGLCKSVAGEYGSKNIRVNVVAPGLIDTPMTQSIISNESNGKIKTGNPIDRAAQPDEVASVLAFLLSAESSFVVGACWNVDGGNTI